MKLIKLFFIIFLLYINNSYFTKVKKKTNKQRKILLTHHKNLINKNKNKTNLTNDNNKKIITRQPNDFFKKNIIIHKKTSMKKNDKTNNQIFFLWLLIIILTFVLCIFFVLKNQYKTFKFKNSQLKNDKENKETLLFILRRKYGKFSKNTYNPIFQIIENNYDGSKFQYISKEQFKKIKKDSSFLKNQWNLIKQSIEQEEDMFIKEICTNKKYHEYIQGIYDEYIKNNLKINLIVTNLSDLVSVFEAQIKEMKKVPIITFDNKNNIEINLINSNFLIKKEDINKLIDKISLKEKNENSLEEIRKFLDKNFQNPIYHSLIPQNIIIKKFFNIINLVENFFKQPENINNLKEKIKNNKISKKSLFVIEDISFYLSVDEETSSIYFRYYESYDNMFLFKLNFNIIFDFNKNIITNISSGRWFFKRNHKIFIQLEEFILIENEILPKKNLQKILYDENFNLESILNNYLNLNITKNTIEYNNKKLQ